MTNGMDVREKDHLWDAVNEIRKDQKEIRRDIGAQGGVLSSINAQLNERCVVRGERLDEVESRQKRLEERVDKIEGRMLWASGVFIAVIFFGEKAFHVFTSWFSKSGG